MAKDRKDSMHDNRPVRHVRVALRDALIGVLAAVAGIGAGWLLKSAGVPFGQAVIGGVAAFGAALYFLERRITD